MGQFISSISQVFPPKPKWTVDDIPDLTGKVIIVTGANTGVGKQTARALLSKNAKVYVAARSEDKANAAIADLKAATNHEGIWLKLDLSDLNSVKAAAQEFLSKEIRLDILFNNAGVMLPRMDAVTAQNYDLQWGTNVVGHHYFAKLLLPTLLESAKSSPDGTTRVVFTSSSGHTLTNNLDFNTFKDGPARRKGSPTVFYFQSKLGNVLQANEFARLYGDRGVVFTSVNPGNLRSELQRNIDPKSLTARIINALCYPVELGALTQLYCGTSPEGKNFGGEYFIPWARHGSATATARDEKLAKELFKWLDEEFEKFESGTAA